MTTIPATQPYFRHPWKIIRFQDWYPHIGLALFPLAPDSARDLALIAKSLAFTCVYLAWGFCFNNLFDTEEDSSEKNSFKQWAPNLAIVGTVLLTMGILFLSFRLGVLLGFSAILLLNVLYSMPPFRFKRSPNFSLLANGFFFASICYFSTSILSGQLTWRAAQFCFLVFFLFVAAQQAHNLQHWADRNLRGIPSIMKIFSILLFLPICAIVSVPEFPALAPVRFAAFLFAIFSALSILLLKDPLQMRKAIRYAGMVLGIYILYSNLVFPASYWISPT